MGELWGDLAARYLLDIKELDAVTDGLRANDDQAAGENTDLSPVAAQAIGGQVAEVDELALAGDLSEGGTVVLAEGDDLSAVLGGPTPRGRTASVGTAAEGRVGKEVVQVNLHTVLVEDQHQEIGAPLPYVVAPEGVVVVASDGLGEAIDTLGVAELRVLGTVHQASLRLSLPLGLLLIVSHLAHDRSRSIGRNAPYHFQAHDVGVDLTRGILLGGTSASSAGHAEHGRASGGERANANHFDDAEEREDCCQGKRRDLDPRRKGRDAGLFVPEALTSRACHARLRAIGGGAGR
jgi:hypothetical protein